MTKKSKREVLTSYFDYIMFKPISPISLVLHILKCMTLRDRTIIPIGGRRFSRGGARFFAVFVRGSFLRKFRVLYKNILKIFKKKVPMRLYK